jgi:DNA-binding response OmpR family regulator
MPLPLSVMIVDDDWDTTYLFKLYLARLGFDSITFTDPNSALAHFQQNPGRYRLVLLDWSMPRLDGLALAKMMRKYNTQVKILFITAYFIQDLIEKHDLMQAQITDVMLKPIWPKDLGVRIEQLHSSDVDTIT